jgi:hypothetical protein
MTIKNHPATAGLAKIHFIPVDQIPTLKRGRRLFDLENLSVVQDFRTMLSRVKSSGAAPYEVSAEIDLTGSEMEQAAAKMKRVRPTLRLLFKSLIKAAGLEGKLDIVGYDHGSRYFVIGRGQTA